MLSFYGKTANEAWEKVMDFIDKSTKKPAVESRYAPVTWQDTNVIIEISDPTRNIVDSPLRNLNMRYAVGELLWYLSGSNNLKDIRQFSSFWDKLSPDGKTITSAYGYKIFKKGGKQSTQFENLIKELEKDRHSRRAVIMLHNEEETNDKDHPCTLSLQFQIVDNKLEMTTVMRSNDLWMGFPYDVFFFTSLQIIVSMILGVELGKYTHFVGNLHLYEADYEKYKRNTPTYS